MASPFGRCRPRGQAGGEEGVGGRACAVGCDGTFGGDGFVDACLAGGPACHVDDVRSRGRGPSRARCGDGATSPPFGGRPTRITQSRPRPAASRARSDEPRADPEEQEAPALSTATTGSHPSRAPSTAATHHECSEASGNKRDQVARFPARLGSPGSHHSKQQRHPYGGHASCWSPGD